MSTVVIICLGATTTVVVAWGCGLDRQMRGCPTVYECRVQDARQTEWTVRTGAKQMQTFARYRTWISPAPAAPPGWNERLPDEVRLITVALHLDGPSPAVQPRPWSLVTQGWPRRALWCEYREDGPMSPTGGVLVREDSGRHPLILPFRPIWPAFWFDTAVYSAGWSAILCVPVLTIRVVRAVSRPRAGHCPKCGYDLRHDLAAGCPECGWGRKTDALSPPAPL